MTKFDQDESESYMYYSPWSFNGHSRDRGCRVNSFREPGTKIFKLLFTKKIALNCYLLIFNQRSQQDVCYANCKFAKTCQ